MFALLQYHPYIILSSVGNKTLYIGLCIDILEMMAYALNFRWVNPCHAHMHLSSLWCVQMIGYIIAWISHSFVYTSHLIWIIYIILCYACCDDILYTWQVRNDFDEDVYLLCRLPRHWTYQINVKYILSIVCLRLSRFLKFFKQYVYPCVCSLPIISCGDCKNMRILSYYRHQIGYENHQQLFGVTSWISGIALSCSCHHTASAISIHYAMGCMFSRVHITLQSNCHHLFMMTSSNGNIFRVTGPLCGEFTGPGEFPAQRPVTRSFDVFFDLRPNKRLSK